MTNKVRFSILLGIVAFGVGVVLSSCGVSVDNSNTGNTTSQNTSNTTDNPTSSNITENPTSSNSTSTNSLRVPVYTGMTIKRNGKKNSQKYTDTIKNANGDDSQGETTSGGEEVPPVENGTEVPPVETGEDDKEELENDIEDIVKVTVSGDETTKYYVNPGEVFTVEVHIDNPDDCEIQSFTLNGKKYSNYMFNTGSTMELLLLDVTAPTNPGYVEYTIDAIKYIDGVEIKDVRLDGEQTIKAGVKYTKDPVVEVLRTNIGVDDVEISLKLTDEQEVLKGNEVRIYLSDGKEIVGEKTLVLGDNLIQFDNLLTDKIYEYGVFTHYDLLDGEFDSVRALHTNSFNTLKAFSFKNVSATQNSIRFDFDQKGEGNVIYSIALYDADNGGTLVKKLEDTSSRVFDNLLSNHNYRLRVAFGKLDNQDNLVEAVDIVEVKTLVNSTPSLSLDVTNIGKDFIDFNIDVQDINEVGNISSIELFKGEELVKSLDKLTLRRFDNLLSGIDYKVVVKYEYNLNDGTGVRVITVEEEVTTLAFYLPVVAIEEKDVTRTSVSFDVVIDDKDDIVEITAIELYEGDTLVKSLDLASSKQFNNLKTDTTYTIVVSYEYDLNDGEGVISNKLYKDIKTLTYTVPKVSVEATTSTRTDIDFEITISDPDKVGQLSYFELYKGEDLIKTITDTTIRRIEGLEENTNYTIVVYYQYDLNDGNGLKYISSSTSYPTVSSMVSVSEIKVISNNTIKVGEEINLRIDFVNPSNVTLVQIYINGQPVDIFSGDAITRAFVKFVPETEAGEYEFVVTSVDYVSYDQIISQRIETDASEKIMIFDNLEVVGLETLSYDEYINIGVSTVSILTLNNEKDYTVYAINDATTPFVKIDKNTYLVYSNKIQEILYGYDGYEPASIKLAFEVKYVNYAEVNGHISLELVAISSVEDFLNSFETVTPENFDRFTGDYKYYYLTCDLDFSSVKNWEPKRFYGVFNGNGHTIKGFEYVLDANSIPYKALGMFVMPSSNQAIVSNLNIEDCYISINEKIGPTSVRNIDISPLGNVFSYNCSVTGNMLFSSASSFRTVRVFGCNSDINWGEKSMLAYDNIDFSSSNSFNTRVKFGNSAYQYLVQKGQKIESTNRVFIENGALYKKIGYDKYIFLGIIIPEEFNGRIIDGTSVLVDGCLSTAECEFVVVPSSVVYITGQIADDSIVVLFESDKLPKNLGKGWETYLIYYVECENYVIGKEYSYVVNKDGKAYITKYHGSNTEVVIPSYIDNHEVVAIGEKAFYYNDFIKKVTLPNTIVEIKSEAFSNATNLVEIILNEGLSTIGVRAFYNCTSLLRANLPSSLIRIEDYAFNGCSSLLSIVIPNSVTYIGSYAFKGSGLKSLSVEEDSNLTYIGEYAFSALNHISEDYFVIPNSVEYIGKAAFAYSKNLIVYLNGDSNLTYIGEFAFSGNKKSVLYLSNKVTHIGFRAFDEVKGVLIFAEPSSKPEGWNDNWIPSQLKDNVKWGAEKFDVCCRYEDFLYFNYDNEITITKYIGNETVVEVPSEIEGVKVTTLINTFDSSDVKKVTLPDSIISIGQYTFNNCSFLEEINLNEGIRDIGDYAFYKCIRIKDIVLPSSLVYLGAYSFFGCIGIETIAIPTSLVSIGDYAFSECRYLSEVVIEFDSALEYIGIAAFADTLTYAMKRDIIIPDSVKFIGDYAFQSFSANIIISSNSELTTIGKGAFYGIGGGKINLTNRVEVIGDSAFGYSSDLNIYVESETKLDGWSDTWCGDQGSLTCPKIHWGKQCEAGVYENEFVYFSIDGEATISSYIGNKSIVEIPSTINGNKVVSFGDIFRENTTITKIVVPSTVVSIDDYAFYLCSELTEVVLEDGIKEIGKYSFYQCKKLKKCDLPSSLVKIGERAFYDCFSLESINIPASLEIVEDSAFSNCRGVRSFTIEEGSSLAYVGNYAFSFNFENYKLGVEMIILPDTLTYIGDYAFYSFEDTRFIMSDKSQLTYVGTRAFYGNKNSIFYLSEKVTFVGQYAFSSSSGNDLSSSVFIQMVSIPSTWDPNAFNGNNLYFGIDHFTYGRNEEFEYINVGEGIIIIQCNTESAYIVVPESIDGTKVISIGIVFRKNKYVENIVLPDTITEIVDYAFEDCTNLVSINIPSSVKDIGEKAFYNCTSLTGVVLPESLINIGDSAFYNCCSLTSIVIPNSVVNIGKGAFYYCSKLVSITINEGSVLEFIGENAFYSYGVSSNLVSKVYIPSTLKHVGIAAFSNRSNITFVFADNWQVDYIGDSAFYNCNGIEVFLRSDISYIGYRAFGECRNTSIYTDATERQSGWDVNWLGANNQSNSPKIYWGAGSFSSGFLENGIKYLNINGEISIIGYEGNSTSIEIPNLIDGFKVVAIKDAFKSNNIIEEVILPDSLEVIDSYAFYQCTKLKKITIQEGVKDINEYAFYNCTSLQSIDLPSSLVNINNHAFYNCNSITSLVIPASVVLIGEGAFGNCSKIESIVFEGDSLETIGNSAFYNLSSLTTEVIIPDSVTYIGSYAFRYTKAEFVLSKDSNVTYIGNSAFEGCGKSSFYLSNKVNYVGSNFVGNPSGKVNIYVQANEKPNGWSDNWATNNNYVEIFWGVGDISIGTYEDFEYTIMNNEVIITAYIGESKDYLVIPSSIDGFDVRKIKIQDYEEAIVSEYIYIPQTVESIVGTEIRGNVLYGGSSISSAWPIQTDKYKVFLNAVDLIYSEDKAFLFVVKNDNTCEIIEYCIEEVDVVIPSSINGYNVTSFGDVFRENPFIESVYLPNTILNIEAYAFYCCERLTTINIPDGVRSIGDYAFAGCSALQAIIIPDSVTSIGSRAFYGCSSMESVTLSSSLVEINDYAFYYCSKLESILIPASVTYIGEYVFASMNGLKEIIFEDNSSLEYIGNSAFSGLNNWNADLFMIPNSVKHIGNYAFWSCSSVSFVISKESQLTYIGENAFYYYTNDKRSYIYLSSKVETIGKSAFGGSNMYIYAQAKYRPSGWNVLWNKYDAFSSNVTWGVDDFGVGITEGFSYVKINSSITLVDYKGENLKLLRIPRTIDGCTVTRIEGFPRGYFKSDYIFIHKDIEFISEAVVDGSVYYEGNSIPDNWSKNWLLNRSTNKVIFNVRDIVETEDGFEVILFNDDTAEIFNYKGTETEIVVPSVINGCRVTSINGAFKENNKITSVVLPDSLITIGDNTFLNCSSLVSVELNDGLKDIGNYAFCNCTSLSSISIPSSVVKIGYYAFYNSSISSLTFEEGCSVETIGVCSFSECDSLASVIIPSSVVSIGNSAFSGCSSLTSLVFEEGGSLELISDSAFSYCNISNEVHIPDNVSVIEEYAFTNNTNMAFYISTESKLSYIGYYAFNTCRGESIVYLSNNVTYVGGGAFSSSNTAIYCEAESKPTDWDNGWLGDNSIKPKVTWGVSFNEGNYSSEDFDYMVVNGELTIYGCHSDKEYVVIPESIEGKQVTRIDLMDSSAKIEINKIFIPSSVSFIRKNTISGTVFYGGESVPSSFDSDWYEGTLFLNCKGLTEDENFKYILFNDGRSSLYEFKGTLTEVVIPESINGFAVYKIENNVFNNNDNITSVTLPSTLMYIGDYAFYDCDKLLSITIPQSVLEIGRYAFCNCDLVTSIDIEEGSVLEYIGERAFSSVKGNIVIPNSVKYIGDYAFSYGGITFAINKESQLTYIGTYAFYGGYDGKDYGISTVYLSSKVEYVGKNAFYLEGIYIYCELSSKPSTWLFDFGNADSGTVVWGVSRFEMNQTDDGFKYILVNDDLLITGYVGDSNEIVIPNQINGETVTNIGKRAFYKSKASSITLPSNLLIIDDYAFYQCTRLQEITIPSSVLEIRSYSFLGCSTLRSIIIPSSVVKIGDCAFQFCDSVTTLSIGEGSVLEYIGESAFSQNTSISGTLNLPDSVKYIGDYAFFYSNLIICNTKNSRLTYIGSGAFMNVGTTGCILYISNKVTAIGYSAFGSSSFTIYCEAESKPNTWDENWFNSSNGTVNWGVQF